MSELLALIQGPGVPGDQWRIIRPFDQLAQRGVSARWCRYDRSLPPSDPERTVLLVRMVTGTSESDIDRWFSEHRRQVRAIVYECDDLIGSAATVDHLEAADFMRGRTRDELLHEGELTRYFISQCDGMIVSSQYLADDLRAITQTPPVVVPNAIDVDWFRGQLDDRPRLDARLSIGWAGGRRPDADVEAMATAWGRIARAFPDVRFVIAAPRVPEPFYRALYDELMTDRVEVIPWKAWSAYPPAYQVDIGCCSVAETPFSRAKSPIKAWEYALAGAAVVGSPTLYGPCLRARGSGAVARTADDWEAELTLLVLDPGLRMVEADALALHVQQAHALAANVHRWPDAVEAIVRQKEGRSYATREGVQPALDLVEHQGRATGRQEPHARGRDCALGRPSRAPFPHTVT